MDFFLRLPAKLLSAALLIVIIPFSTMVLGAAVYNFGDAPDFLVTMSNFDYYPISILLTTLLILGWCSAVVIRLVKLKYGSPALLLPLIIAALFIVLSMPSALTLIPFLHDTFYPVEMLIWRTMLDNVSQMVCMLTGFTSLIISALVTVFSIVRLTGSGLPTWFTITVQFLFLPVGILWLQPRLQNHYSLAPDAPITEHLVG